MLDFVQSLDAAGAAAAFDTDVGQTNDAEFQALVSLLRQDGADAVAQRLGLPAIRACVVIAPDQGETETERDHPQQDDDGRGDDADDRTDASPD